MCGHGAVGASGGMPTQYRPAQTGGSTTQVAGASGGPAGHEGHGHDSILYKLKDSPPNANQFIEGSLGASAGKDFKLDKGVGFGGKKGRDPNGNDQKQNNLKKADANRPAYGIPTQVAGTNKKPNYVQDIQVSIGMGGLEKLRPEVLQKLIDNQNAGKGSVWNGVAYLTGLIDQHDGSVSPDLVAQRDQIMQTPVGQSGKTLAQWAKNPKDENGTNWARSNHAMTGIKTYLDLEKAGIPPEVANKLANNDDLVSGAGRIDQIAPGRASNNQENTFTGMNGAERKEWAKAAKYAKDLNRPDILRILMDSHTMGSHMLTQYGNKGAKSKINQNLGLDPNMPTEQRKQTLVNYFLQNAKDPKKGEGKDEGKRAQEGVKADVKQADKPADAPAEPVQQGGGAGAPEVAAGGGCNMDPKQGADALGGGAPGSVEAILAQLAETLKALVAAISSGSVAGTSGGGDPAQKKTEQKTAVQQAQSGAQQTTQQTTMAGGHAH